MPTHLCLSTPPYTPIIHNPHSHTPFSPNNFKYTLRDSHFCTYKYIWLLCFPHTNKCDHCAFTVYPPNVTISCLAMLGNHQSLSGNQIAILGCPVGNHLPIKFGKPWVQWTIIIIIIFIRINNYTYRVHIKHLSTNYIKIFRIENKLYYNNYFYKIIVIQYNI